MLAYCKILKKRTKPKSVKQTISEIELQINQKEIKINLYLQMCWDYLSICLAYKVSN